MGSLVLQSIFAKGKNYKSLAERNYMWSEFETCSLSVEETTKSFTDLFFIKLKNIEVITEMMVSKAYPTTVIKKKTKLQGVCRAYQEIPQKYFFFFT